jgi:branched-chain amino acid transport system substrate-binding protein
MIRPFSCAVAGAVLLVAANSSGTPSHPESAAPSAEAGPILVGEVAALSGSETNYGQSVDHGIQLAFEQINARGGVKGRPISLRAEDDQSQPGEAANAIKLLINTEHVVAVLGDVTSTLSLAIAPVAQENSVPLITPSSTSVKVTKTGDYVFRTCFTDPFQGQAMARFARDTLKLSKVAILRDAASEYSMGLADAFAQTFKEAGGQIVDDESYHKGDLDFRPKLTKIKAADPQAIFVPGYDNDVGFIARQARGLGIPSSVPLLGGDGWDSAGLADVGGVALDGSYFTNHYSADDMDPRVQAFVTAYEKRYGAKPDALAAMGYDAAGILANALGRATSLSGPALRDAIARTTDFPGVTGIITINGERNAATPAVILKVNHGKYQFVARVNP